MCSVRIRDHLSGKQIAILHVAKRDLGLADDDYRAILARYGGCESAAELDALGFDRVMRYFTELGFRSTWTKRTFGNRPGMATPAQVDLIRSLWRRFDLEDVSEIHLNAWLSKYHKISALRFVSAEKAGAVITALKSMTTRMKNG